MKELLLTLILLSATACSSKAKLAIDPLGLHSALEAEETIDSPPTVTSLEEQIAEKKVHLNLLHEQIFHQLYSGHIQELESQIFDLEAQKAELLHQKPQSSPL